MYITLSRKEKQHPLLAKYGTGYMYVSGICTYRYMYQLHMVADVIFGYMYVKYEAVSCINVLDVQLTGFEQYLFTLYVMFLHEVYM